MDFTAVRQSDVAWCYGAELMVFWPADVKMAVNLQDRVQWRDVVKIEMNLQAG
jgi:hypothetical protein